MIFTTIVCILAGLGAGFGTGFAGISAATVISPMLIGLLGISPYQAIGIALLSDVLASASTARTYAKAGNIDIKGGLLMMVTVLIMTAVGSLVAVNVPDNAMGYFATIMTTILGLKFFISPVRNTEYKIKEKSRQRRIAETLICGIYIGFVCGFIGAGGGLMMLFVLTAIIGYNLKKAIGTSVFIMTFTALTGGISHIISGGIPDLFVLIECSAVTLVAARGSADIANHIPNETLNRATGTILVIVGVSMTALKVARNCWL